jgi:hypothetical protein
MIVLGCAVCGRAQSEVGEKVERSTALGAITGRVVNESGQPMANAVVTVRGYAAADSRAVTTDEEGNFRVADLPPLAYLVSARSAAYVPRPRDPDLNPIGYYRIGESVRLEMMKGAVITGAVKRSNSEPVVSVPVSAYMIRDSKGQPVRYSTGRQAITDDRGVYRIYGLPPGTYIVAAGGGSTSGYSVDPFATDVPTYAPSSTRDTATQLTVAAGDETTNVDIQYQGEPGHYVSGSVTTLAATQSERSYQLTLSSTLNGVEQAAYESYQSPNAPGFAFAGVADGEYDVVARNYSTSGLSVSESRRIKVRGADVTGIELNVKPLASMNGTVVLEDSKAPECQSKRRPLFGEMVIGPWHNEKNPPRDQPQFIWGLGGPVTPDKQGSFTLRNLGAGQYRFVTRPPEKFWYLKSISWPAAPKATQANQPLDAAGNWTTIKSGDRYSGLTITFAGGAASIAGRVDRADQKPYSGLFIYLTPAEVDKRDDVLRYFVARAAEDGSFVMSNVPPGRYWVVAKPAAETDTNMLSRLRMPDERELRLRILHDAETQKIETELRPCQNVSEFRLAFSPQ